MTKFTQQQALTGNLLVTDKGEVYIRMCGNGEGLGAMWYKLDPLTSNLVWVDVDQVSALDEAYFSSKGGFQNENGRLEVVT